MKRFVLFLVFICSLCLATAQKINPVGTWNESGGDRTWIFNANGTKALIGTMRVQLPFSNHLVYCDFWQKRTDEKWVVNGNTITFTAIPLQISPELKNLDLDGFTAAQKAQIKAGIPKLKQQIIAESKTDWANKMVGKKNTCTVESFTPMRMVLNFDGSLIVLIRDTSKMTAAEKAAIDKKMEAFKGQETENKAQEVTNPVDQVYDVVDEMPEFPEGPSALFQYLSQNIQYPPIAKQEGIEGRVIVSFIVERDGFISNVKISKSVDPSLDKEAIRLIESMPQWTPGKQNGEPVRVKYAVPVTFKL